VRLLRVKSEFFLRTDQRRYNNAAMAVDVNIRQLRALDAIVRLGSFVEASRALHVTPAALSLAIRDLEERLGFALLERTTRSVRLSEAGRGYLPFAQRALAGLAEAERYAREMQQGRGVVRIATSQSIIGTLLAAVLPEVHAAWPNIRIHPLDVATVSIADSLLDRQADLAIGVRFESNDAIEVKTFFRSSWHAFLAVRHPLADRRELPWQALHGQQLFMNKSSHLSLQLALGEAAPLRNVYDVAAAISGLAMASAGTGIAVFPGYVLPLASVAGVRPVPLVAPVVPHELQIAAARQPTTAAPLHQIRDAFVRAAQKNGMVGQDPGRLPT